MTHYFDVFIRRTLSTSLKDSTQFLSLSAFVNGESNFTTAENIAIPPPCPSLTKRLGTNKEIPISSSTNQLESISPFSESMFTQCFIVRHTGNKAKPSYWKPVQSHAKTERGNCSMGFYCIFRFSVPCVLESCTHECSIVWSMMN